MKLSVKLVSSAHDRDSECFHDVFLQHTSSVAMGDPVKIAERETTHAASFSRPTVCRSAAFLLHWENSHHVTQFTSCTKKRQTAEETMAEGSGVGLQISFQMCWTSLCHCVFWLGVSGGLMMSWMQKLTFWLTQKKKKRSKWSKILHFRIITCHYLKTQIIWCWVYPHTNPIKALSVFFKQATCGERAFETQPWKFLKGLMVVHIQRSLLLSQTG